MDLFTGDDDVFLEAESVPQTNAFETSKAPRFQIPTKSVLPNTTTQNKPPAVNNITEQKKRILPPSFATKSSLIPTSKPPITNPNAQPQPMYSRWQQPGGENRINDQSSAPIRPNLPVGTKLNLYPVKNMVAPPKVNPASNNVNKSIPPKSNYVNRVAVVNPPKPPVNPIKANSIINKIINSSKANPPAASNPNASISDPANQQKITQPQTKLANPAASKGSEVTNIKSAVPPASSKAAAVPSKASILPSPPSNNIEKYFNVKAIVQQAKPNQIVPTHQPAATNNVEPVVSSTSANKPPSDCLENHSDASNKADTSSVARPKRVLPPSFSAKASLIPSNNRPQSAAPTTVAYSTNPSVVTAPVANPPTVGPITRPPPLAKLPAAPVKPTPPPAVQPTTSKPPPAAGMQPAVSAQPAPTTGQPAAKKGAIVMNGGSTTIKMGSSLTGKPPEIDTQYADNWIFPISEATKKRDYQFNIVQTALTNNTLVCLPTGLGKTFIASVLMFNYYLWFPKGKILFMAPTKPLVTQQCAACKVQTRIRPSEISEMTGKVTQKTREEHWKNKRVFFLTPQILNNDIQSSICDPSNIVLIIVDEAHRAQGKYAYCEAIKYVRTVTSYFRVLALSATPGSDKKAVQAVIQNLQISKIEMRTDDSEDVKVYMHEREVEIVKVPLNTELKEVKALFIEVLKEVVDWLFNQKVIFQNDPEKISGYTILIYKKKFEKATGRDPTHQALVLSKFYLAIKLYSAYKVLQSHGIAPFATKIQKFYSEAGEKKTTSGMSRMVQSPNFVRLLTWISMNTQNTDSFHPKFNKLQEILVDYSAKLRRYSDSRIMIFTEFRDTVNEIISRISDIPGISAEPFIGQAGKKGTAQKGMNQKQQQKVLAQFREGKFNTLVCTSIGEEGLDIGEVDLIICFDSQTSPTRVTQRMGRTGRKRDGKCIIMMTEGSEASNYSTSKSKSKTVNKVLNEKKFVFFESLRMTPSESPELTYLDLEKDELLFTETEETPGESSKAKKKSSESDPECSNQPQSLTKYLRFQNKATPTHLLKHSAKSKLLVSICKKYPLEPGSSGTPRKLVKKTSVENWESTEENEDEDLEMLLSEAEANFPSSSTAKRKEPPAPAKNPSPHKKQKISDTVEKKISNSVDEQHSGKLAGGAGVNKLNRWAFQPKSPDLLTSPVSFFSPPSSPLLSPRHDEPARQTETEEKVEDTEPVNQEIHFEESIELPPPLDIHSPDFILEEESRMGAIASPIRQNIPPQFLPSEEVEDKEMEMEWGSSPSIPWKTQEDSDRELGIKVAGLSFVPEPPSFDYFEKAEEPPVLELKAARVSPNINQSFTFTPSTGSSHASSAEKGENSEILDESDDSLGLFPTQRPTTPPQRLRKTKVAATVKTVPDLLSFRIPSKASEPKKIPKPAKLPDPPQKVIRPQRKQISPPRRTGSRFLDDEASCDSMDEEESEDFLDDSLSGSFIASQISPDRSNMRAIYQMSLSSQCARVGFSPVKFQQNRRKPPPSPYEDIDDSPRSSPDVSVDDSFIVKSQEDDQSVIVLDDIEDDEPHQQEMGDVEEIEEAEVLDDIEDQPLGQDEVFGNIDDDLLFDCDY